MYKRVLTVQDISCVGQCSLTAALPVISACGVECAVLPTAILSNHTAKCFSAPSFHDLTPQLDEIWNRWRGQGIGFDAIGVGYLGSKAQIRQIRSMMADCRSQGTKLFLDPVMADHGRFYKGFDMDYAGEMAQLCRESYVMLPNLTEAHFLLGETQVPEQYDEDYCRRLAQRLIPMAGQWLVITGLSCYPGMTSNLICCCETGEMTLLSRPRLPGSYHGTGDLFASALMGLTMQGRSLKEAAEQAAEFVAAAIANTEAEHLYGVRFEGCLGMLTK